jgi:hypothetical protein
MKAFPAIHLVAILAFGEVRALPEPGLKAIIPGCKAEVRFRVPVGFSAANNESEMAVQDSINFALQRRHPKPGSRALIFSPDWKARSSLQYITLFQDVLPEFSGSGDSIANWNAFKNEILSKKEFSRAQMGRVLSRIGIGKSEHSGFLQSDSRHDERLFYIYRGSGILTSCKIARTEGCGPVSMCFSVPETSRSTMKKFVQEADVSPK